MSNQLERGRIGADEEGRLASQRTQSLPLVQRLSPGEHGDWFSSEGRQAPS